jgi:ArsR family transcriptional regulator, arsenate/arsenite/antimonite-responsive transcriptional repressor
MSNEEQGKITLNTEEQAAVFSALADPTRLKLVKLLCRQHRPDALCVNALAGLLGVSQSAVSQHLRVLKSIGLVKGERRSYHIHYFVNQDVLEKCQTLASAALTMEEPSEEKSCQEYCTGNKKHLQAEAKGIEEHLTEMKKEG